MQDGMARGGNTRKLSVMLAGTTEVIRTRSRSGVNSGSHTTWTGDLNN